MARLVKCKACGKEISRNAKQCPSCGEPLPKGVGCLGWTVVIIVGYIVFKVATDLNVNKPHPSENSTRTVQLSADDTLAKWMSAPRTAQMGLSSKMVKKMANIRLSEAQVNLKAAELVSCIDEVAIERKLSKMKISEIAVACHLSM